MAFEAGQAMAWLSSQNRKILSVLEHLLLLFAQDLMDVLLEILQQRLEILTEQIKMKFAFSKNKLITMKIQSNSDCFKLHLLFNFCDFLFVGIALQQLFKLNRDRFAYSFDAIMNARTIQIGDLLLWLPLWHIVCVHLLLWVSQVFLSSFSAALSGFVLLYLFGLDYPQVCLCDRFVLLLQIAILQILDALYENLLDLVIELFTGLNTSE
jgi:hypothetical protein